MHAVTDGVRTAGETFAIDVVEQRWLTDRDADLCSHGRLAITIGDVVVPRDRYVGAICALADAVVEFFGTREKRIGDDWDRSQYEAFWCEFDERLARARAEL